MIGAAETAILLVLAVFSLCLYISRNFNKRCRSFVMPDDFGNVAGNDLTLPELDFGRCNGKVGDSGIGGGGGRRPMDLMAPIVMVESRDWGREGGPARVALNPAGRAATARISALPLIDECLLSAVGRGPSLILGLSKKLKSRGAPKRSEAEGRADWEDRRRLSGDTSRDSLNWIVAPEAVFGRSRATSRATDRFCTVISGVVA